MTAPGPDVPAILAGRPALLDRREDAHRAALHGVEPSVGRLAEVGREEEQRGRD